MHFRLPTHYFIGLYKFQMPKSMFLPPRSKSCENYLVQHTNDEKNLLFSPCDEYRALARNFRRTVILRLNGVWLPPQSVV